MRHESWSPGSVTNDDNVGLVIGSALVGSAALARLQHLFEESVEIV